MEFNSGFKGLIKLELSPNRFLKNTQILCFAKIFAVETELFPTNIRTKRHDAANSLFPQFCESLKKKQPKTVFQVVVCRPAAQFGRRGSFTFVMEVTSRSHNRDPEYFLLSSEENPQQTVVFFTLQISPPPPGSHEAAYTTRLIGGPLYVTTGSS